MNAPETLAPEASVASPDDFPDSGDCAAILGGGMSLP
jgi:hypothetical protein